MTTGQNNMVKEKKRSLRNVPIQRLCSSEIWANWMKLPGEEPGLSLWRYIGTEENLGYIVHCFQGVDLPECTIKISYKGLMQIKDHFRPFLLDSETVKELESEE